MLANVSSLKSIATGSSSMLTISGMSSNIGQIVTGTQSNAEFDGSVTGLASLTEGASGSLSFLGSALSGTGTIGIGANANASIYGTVSGFKQITIGTGATLTLTGTDANVPIAMSSGSTLVIGPTTPIDATISGFSRGDVIETLLANHGTIITAADFTAGQIDNGSLVLSDDGVNLDTLTLTGSFSGYQFLTNASGAGGTTDITVAPALQAPH
jgi:hypothetical protein